MRDVIKLVDFICEFLYVLGKVFILFPESLINYIDMCGCIGYIILPMPIHGYTCNILLAEITAIWYSALPFPFIQYLINNGLYLSILEFLLWTLL